MRVLVTGANGIVGSRLCQQLTSGGHAVVAAVREEARATGLACVAARAIGDIGTYDAWSQTLEGIEAVVHLAARVHLAHESAADPLAAYRQVNTVATVRLADAARARGVRRLVFVSTAQVHGLGSGSRPFVESDVPRPETPYGESKLEAEQRVTEILHGSATECVIVRPPLVYGPAVKGTLERLMRLVATRLPLPFASLQNRRSMIGLDNLVAFLQLALEHPSAKGQHFLVSDGRDVSTPEVIRMIAEGMGLAPRLVPCPVGLLTGLAALAGRGAEMKRLCGSSFQVDEGLARRLLAWRAPRSSAEGLREMAQSFLGMRYKARS